MSEVVMIKKHDLDTKTSVYGVHEYGCNYCIAPKSEQILRKRGFHMTDDEIKDMLYNLPEVFKPFVRFIKNENEAKHYEIEKVEQVEELIEAKEEMKKELEADEVVETEPVLEGEEIEEVEPVFGDAVIAEGIKVNIPTILDTDYSEFDEDQLYKFRIELKAYAKENGIKIHPALKNIETIILKIKG